MPDTNEGFVLDFRYPSIYKWLGGFCTLFFLFLSLVSSLPLSASDLRLPALFLAFAAVGFYVWWMVQGRVLVDSRSVTLRRFGRSTRIEYAEVTAVRHLSLRNALVIEAYGKKIRVEKQLERYPFFYKYVSLRLPPFSTGLSTDLPLEVHARTWVQVMTWLCAAGGLLILGLALSLLLHGETEGAASAAVMGALIFSLGVYGVTKSPRGYVFYVDRVEVGYPWGANVFPLEDLRGMRLEGDAQLLQAALSLRLVFDGGQIQLADLAVDYAPEALANVLTAKYLSEEDAYEAGDEERGDGAGEDGRPRVEVAPAVAGPPRVIRVRRARWDRWLLAIGALLGLAVPELARVLLRLLRGG